MSMRNLAGWSTPMFLAALVGCARPDAEPPVSANASPIPAVAAGGDTAISALPGVRSPTGSAAAAVPTAVATQPPLRDSVPPPVERRVVGDTTIVRTMLGGAWGDSVRLVEELSIGVLDGDTNYIFGAAIQGLTVGLDGSIYVIDRGPTAGTAVFRQYTSTGKFLRRFGRTGQGPGEFGDPLGLTTAKNGDLLMFDSGTNRVQIFDSAGAWRSAWTLPTGVRSTASRGLLSDGSGGVLVPGTIRPSDPAAPSQVVFHFNAAGVVDTLPLPRCEQTAPSGPFQPTCQRVMHPSGQFLVGWTERYSFDLLRPNGTRLRIERALPLQQLLPEEEAERRARLTGRPDAVGFLTRTTPDGRAVTETTFAPAQILRTTKPAFRSFLVGLDGRIWVQISTRAERITPPPPEPTTAGAPAPLRWAEPVVYDVFEPDGRYMGQVRMPPNASLSAMRGDYAWGVRRGDLDEAYIVRWRIVRGTGR